MKRRSRVMRFLSLLSLAALALGMVVSCSGGGGGSNNTTISTTTQAANSSSSAMGAVKLSSTVGESANLASGAIPASYAPGKMKTIDTSDIAKLDPRLKTVVDSMVTQLQSPIISNAVARTRSMKTMSAPLSAPTGTCYTVTSENITSLQTGTTYNLSITYNNCRDSGIDGYLQLSGSITATLTVNNDSSETANVNTNLTFTKYSDAGFTSVAGSMVMLGDFNSSINGTKTSGTNSAKGSYTMTLPPSAGDLQMSFTFGDSAAVTDAWTDTNPGSPGTVTHTGNGKYTLGITSPEGTLTYGVTLTSLGYSLTTDINGNTDESLNGTVSISWNPDLSQWGCANGSYTFSTTTPVHTSSAAFCPNSGRVQVNNATVQYNPNQSVTVSIGGLSETFPDCDSMGNGMCG